MHILANTIMVDTIGKKKFKGVYMNKSFHSERLNDDALTNEQKATLRMSMELSELVDVSTTHLFNGEMDVETFYVKRGWGRESHSEVDFHKEIRDILLRHKFIEKKSQLKIMEVSKRVVNTAPHYMPYNRRYSEVAHRIELRHLVSDRRLLAMEIKFRTTGVHESLDKIDD